MRPRRHSRYPAGQASSLFCADVSECAWARLTATPGCGTEACRMAVDSKGPQCVNGRSAVRRAFTLIELILVMALLMTVVALVAPRLADFFRGRSLDNEARRLVTLTHYAQSRAVAEGVPMLVWLDEANGRYGLAARPGFLETATDERAVEYALVEQLRLRVGEPMVSVFGSQRVAPYESTFGRQFQMQGVPANVRYVLINPDGFIDEVSAERIELHDQNPQRDPVVLAPARNWQRYEILTNEAHALQR